MEHAMPWANLGLKRRKLPKLGSRAKEARTSPALGRHFSLNPEDRQLYFVFGSTKQTSDNKVMFSRVHTKASSFPI